MKITLHLEPRAIRPLHLSALALLLAFISFGCPPNPTPNPAPVSSPRASRSMFPPAGRDSTGYFWLTRNCGIDDYAKLIDRMKAHRDSIMPLFRIALTIQPGDSLLAPIADEAQEEFQLMRNYAATFDSTAMHGDTNVALGMTLATYIGNARERFAMQFQSRAAVGLMLVADSAQLQQLIAQSNDTTNPSHLLLQDALYTRDYYRAYQSFH